MVYFILCMTNAMKHIKFINMIFMTYIGLTWIVFFNNK